VLAWMCLDKHTEAAESLRDCRLPNITPYDKVASIRSISCAAEAAALQGVERERETIYVCACV
jgi:hypothetical protein